MTRPFRQQAGFLLEAAEVGAHGQRAGGEDNAMVLTPKSGAKLSGHIGGHSAQHGSSPPVLHSIVHQIGAFSSEQLHCGGQLLQLAVYGRREQAVELFLDNSIRFQEYPPPSRKTAPHSTVGAVVPSPAGRQASAQRFCILFLCFAKYHFLSI